MQKLSRYCPTVNEPLKSVDFTCWVEALGKDYGMVQAVRDISFELVPGEVFGLLGPNGSGRSTTLHIQTGLLEASQGSVEVSGVPLDTHSKLI